MSDITAWEKMSIIRNKNRPTIHDYISLIFRDFYEMHGDRYYADDQAILSGIAYLNDMPVTILSHVKGHDVEENKQCNFAMANPEGYRKALRIAKQAEKFNRPIICFIDTPGAFCGVSAEERGQGEAIARNIFEFIKIKTPIISIVLGEGGSGGALALGVCDELAMLENSIYSVISPRGFASILWKDPSKEKDAANIMKITASELLDLNIVDYIIQEAKDGAHNDVLLTSQNISKYIFETINNLLNKSIENLLEDRYNKFRKIGKFKL